MQQTVIEPGAAHLDPLGQYERALELSRRDAAMQVDVLAFLGLFAADHELIVLDRYAEIAHAETGDRERDAQFILGELLNIVGRITIGRDFVHPVERPLEMIEAEQ